jgi:hypothetical protein
MAVSYQELLILRDAIDARLATSDPSTSNNAISLGHSRSGMTIQSDPVVECFTNLTM